MSPPRSPRLKLVRFTYTPQLDAFNGLWTSLGKRLDTDAPPLGFSHAEAIATLDRLFAAKAFTALVSHQEIGGNRTYQRDREVAKWCNEKDIEWRQHQQTGVMRGPIDRDKRHKDWEQFYTSPVYQIPPNLQNLKILDEYRFLLPISATQPPRESPVDLPRDKWMTDEKLLGSRHHGPLHPASFALALTQVQDKYVQPVSERAAQVTLGSFMAERGLDYSKGMSSPNTAFYRCSRLSVHLAWGTISGRSVYQKITARIEEIER